MTLSVILSGRRINDSMGRIAAQRIVKAMICRGKVVRGARVGMLGLTFKENVPDLRNTRVVDIIAELKEFGIEPIVTDAEAYPEEAMRFYGQKLVPLSELKELDAIVLAVPHRVYQSLDPEQLKAFFRTPEDAFVFDIKGFFDKEAMQAAGVDYQRL